MELAHITRSRADVMKQWLMKWGHKVLICALCSEAISEQDMCRICDGDVEEVCERCEGDVDEMGVTCKRHGTQLKNRRLEFLRKDVNSGLAPGTTKPNLFFPRLAARQKQCENPWFRRQFSRMKNSFGYLSKRPKHSLIPNAPFASAMALTARAPSSCVAIVPGLREAEAGDRLTCRRPDAPGYEAPQFLWEAAGLDNEVMEFLVCSRQPRIMLRQTGESR
jgi:hypothetical protein